MNSEKKLKTVDRMLDVAQKMVLREGFRAVSVDRIIAEAAVSKGTFFYPFSSKDKLALAMFDRFMEMRRDEMARRMAKLRSEEPDPLVRLKKLIALIAKDFHGDCAPEGCLVGAFSYQLLEEMPELKKRSVETFERWKGCFAAQFREVEEVYSSSLSDPEALAIMLFSVLQGWMVASRLCTDRAIFKKQAEMFTNYLDLIYGKRQENLE